MASRDTQDEVQEWIMKIGSLAKAEGGPGLGPGWCTPCGATTGQQRQLRSARQHVAKTARWTSGGPSTGKTL
eukprot:5134999-Lingulodinium_polyedra.AAC.1